MKIKNAIIFFCLILILSGVNSCKKGGVGGNTAVVVTVTHHGKGIPAARVYVKYGSYNFPGKDTAIYNSRQITNADAYTDFKDLKRGYYYFYAIGYDSVAGHEVTGSAGLKIKQKEKGSELELNIPVTE